MAENEFSEEFQKELDEEIQRAEDDWEIEHPSFPGCP